MYKLQKVNLNVELQKQMCIVVNLHIREWAKPGFLVMFWYMITAPWALPLQFRLPEVETLNTKTYVIVWLKGNNKCKELILITFLAPVIKFPGKSKKSEKGLILLTVGGNGKVMQLTLRLLSGAETVIAGGQQAFFFLYNPVICFERGSSHTSLANQNYPTEAGPKAHLLDGSRSGQVKG